MRLLPFVFVLLCSSGCYTSYGPMLCGTVECAANPCAPGCVYLHAEEACPADHPKLVSPYCVSTCSDACGLTGTYQGLFVTSTPGGSCVHFNANAPGCGADACGKANEACYTTNLSFDVGGAAICPSTDACIDGGGPAPWSMTCFILDSSAVTDAFVPVDLTTSD